MNRDADPESARRRPPAREALPAVAVGLAAGLALHFLAVCLRDHGPEGAGWSLRGNGAALVLIPATLLLIGGLIVYARRRAWLAMALWPAAMIAGLFVVLGGF
jgi:hypothetical protein